MAEYKDIIEEKKKVLMSLMNDKHYVPMKFKELAVISVSYTHLTLPTTERV